MGLPFLLYLAHALPLAGWVVDDAGITFAYSRSLAHGHGLVAQPGAPPVEGYSNFTWLVLMAPFFWVGAFDPVVTPKIVSAILVLVTFVLLRRAMGVLSAHPDLGTAFVCTLLAANTGFVVWTTSGLENPLYVLLTVLLLERLVATQGTRTASGRMLAALGALCGLIAMTRPDGMVFFAAVPILLALDVLRGGRRLPDALRAGAAHALGAAVIFGGFLLFRRAYFDAWLPNTYYAKGGPTLGALAPPRLIGKVDHFLDSLVPFGEWALFALAVGLLVVWARRTRLAPAGTALIVHAVLAASVFVLLPLDWMTEYRFASVAYPPLYALLFVAAESALRALPLASAPRRVLAGAAIAVFLVWSATGFVPRTEAFVRRPTVPMEEITTRFADRFDAFATAIDARPGSVLLPDVGGTLYYGELRVYDLGKLTDREIARTLERDQRAFYDYVFERARPTFIHTHGVWAYRARLDDDPRFRRDYVPIVEAEDPWVRERGGERMRSGDYVRRDAVTASSLARLRALAGEPVSAVDPATR